MPSFMPISMAVFEPDTLRNMSAAFEATCDKLGLIRGTPQTELVARFVINLAQTGVHDFESLLAETDMSHFLLNIAKRSLLRLMLGGVGLASKNAV
jgi:hypothetical protein